MANKLTACSVCLVLASCISLQTHLVTKDGRKFSSSREVILSLEFHFVQQSRPPICNRCLICIFDANCTYLLFPGKILNKQILLPSPEFPWHFTWVLVEDKVKSLLRLFIHANKMTIYYLNALVAVLQNDPWCYNVIFSYDQRL